MQVHLAGRSDDAHLGARQRDHAGLRHRRLRRVRRGRVDRAAPTGKSWPICPAAISPWNGAADNNVYMTGPATEVFTGDIEI